MSGVLYFFNYYVIWKSLKNQGIRFEYIEEKEEGDDVEDEDEGQESMQDVVLVLVIISLCGDENDLVELVSVFVKGEWEGCVV